MNTSLRAPKAGEAQAMTALALRSKASWGYDAAFMEACIAPLTITEAALKQTLTQVAVDPDHRILGFVMVRFDPEATHLDKLFVEPEAFGLGIGARLMGWAKSAAKARGAVALDIVSDPGAEAFYISCGASRIGLVPSEAMAGRELPLLRLMLT